ncbi:MAG: hypothetical protein CL534_11640 [Ahrensia sp.]|nr:hypothetical protein [Ahrensia sp.]
MSFTVYRSDGFEIDLRRGELLRGGKPQRLEPQVFHLLVHLIANSDRAVGIDELIEVVWNGRLVSDATVLSRISSARAAIGDNGRDQRFIRTLRKVGFRFVGPVEALARQPGEGDNTEPGEWAEAAEAPADFLGAGSTGFMGPAIAVFPFQADTGASEQFFASGLASEIATELARSGNLFVIAPAATAGLTAGGENLRKVARQLGVRYVLKGYVFAVNQRLRLNVQLHDALDLRLVWAERLQGALSDVFAFLDTVVVKTIDRITTKLPQVERGRALRMSADQLNAYEWVLRGDHYHSHMTKDDNDRAIAMYRNAIDLDDRFAPAFAGLAWAQNHRGNQGWCDNQREAIALAYETATASLKLDRRLAKAHSVMGDIRLWRRDHENAVRSGFQAITSDPSHADSRMIFAYCLAMNGDVDEALKQSKLALRHNPFRANRIYYSALGHAHYLAGDFDKARLASVEGIRRDPNHRGLRLLHAAALTRLGETGPAAGEVRVALSLDPELRCSRLENLWPYKAPERLEDFSDMLARCGLPA